MSPRTRTPRRGFTLIEVMVALVLLGLMASVVGPELARFVAGGADRTVRDLLAAAELARDRAVTSGEPVTLAVEVRSGDWLLYSGATPRAGALPIAEGTIRLPDGVALAAPGSAPWAFLRFDPVGGARADRLVVSDRGGRREIFTHPWTASLVATTR